MQIKEYNSHFFIGVSQNSKATYFEHFQSNSVNGEK